ncbi:hypothetical protein IJG21_00540 [Candidatus Saccharibacteria bacterium]|nr:hypothetical protein [Candidatus Saccharibacteria bacterium]
MKILEKVKVLVFASVLAIAGVAAVLPGRAVYAGIQDGADVTKEGNELGQAGDLETTVKNVINIILYVIGIVAVVMMIFGGFQYITSAGDAAKVTKAKNTILYGVVGLVIAILAYAIVNYVLGSLTN